MNTKSLVRLGLRYGITAGVLGPLLMIGIYYMGRHPSLLPVFADFRILMLGIFVFFTLKEFRDMNEGLLGMRQGLLGGYLVTGISGVLGAGVVTAFCAIEPAFVKEYIELLMRQMVSSKEALVQHVGEEAYQYQLKNLPLTTGAHMGLDYFLKSLLIGSFITIIMGVVMRRQPVQR